MKLMNDFYPAAMEYLLTNPLGDVDMKAFEESFGCGVVVTPDQIEAEVARVINSHRAELVEKRYLKALSQYL